MITLLYNLDTQTAGDAREGRYIVDGKTGIYPSNYVELIVQDPPFPSFDPATQKTEYSNYYADIPNLLWTRNITVIPRSQEEIDAEEAAKIANQKEQEYQNLMNAGYLIPGTNIYLGISDQDRASWSQLLTLVNELINTGQMQPSQELSISDKNGVMHSFQLYRIKEILAGLGLYYYQIWSQRKNKI